MRPPRLTVVETGSGGQAPSHDRFKPGDAVPANDAAPAVDGIASGSPVHALIDAIEEGAAGGVVPADPERREKLRILEAVLFAATEPLDEARLAKLQDFYVEQGIVRSKTPLGDLFTNQFVN